MQMLESKHYLLFFTVYLQPRILNFAQVLKVFKINTDKQLIALLDVTILILYM